MNTTPKITVANMETGLCLWEALTDLLRGKRGGHLHTLAEMLTDEEGTPAARQAVIGWVDECESDWEASRQAATELVPYDWEHCPAFLARKLQERFPDVQPPAQPLHGPAALWSFHADLVTRGYEPEIAGGGSYVASRYWPGGYIWLSGGEGTDLPTPDSWMIGVYQMGSEGEPFETVTGPSDPGDLMEENFTQALDRLESIAARFVAAPPPPLPPMVLSALLAAREALDAGNASQEHAYHSVYDAIVMHGGGDLPAKGGAA